MGGTLVALPKTAEQRDLLALARVSLLIGQAKTRASLTSRLFLLAALYAMVCGFSIHPCAPEARENYGQQLNQTLLREGQT